MARFVLIMMWPKSQAAFFPIMTAWSPGCVGLQYPWFWVLFDLGIKEPRQIVCSAKEPEMEVKDMVFGFSDTRLGLIFLGGFCVLFDYPSANGKAGLDFLVLVVVYAYGKEDYCSVTGTLTSVCLWIHVLLCLALPRPKEALVGSAQRRYTPGTGETALALLWHQFSTTLVGGCLLLGAFAYWSALARVREEAMAEQRLEKQCIRQS